MATVAQLLTVATGELGYTESPPDSNRTKYWAAERPGWQGSAWCGAFVQWCLRKAGMPLPLDNPYFVPYVEIWAKANGKWHDKPQPGDLVIFGIPGAYHTAQHIGILEKVREDGFLQVIEGNASPGISGSQNNGGGVYRRLRGPGWIRGFVRLDYDAPARPPASTTPGAYLTEDGILDVATLMIFQKLWGVTRDGVWGPATTRGLQRWVGVTADGVAGPVTITALQRRVSAPVTGTWSYGWRTRPTTTTRALEAYLNRAIRRGTFTAK